MFNLNPYHGSFGSFGVNPGQFGALLKQGMKSGGSAGFDNWLKTRLEAWGFPVEGDIHEALASFQHIVGLPPDGMARKATVEMLKTDPQRHVDVPMPNLRPSEPTAPSPIDTRSMERSPEARPSLAPSMSLDSVSHNNVAAPQFTASDHLRAIGDRMRADIKRGNTDDLRYKEPEFWHLWKYPNEQRGATDHPDSIGTGNSPLALFPEYTPPDYTPQAPEGKNRDMPLGEFSENFGPPPPAMSAQTFDDRFNGPPAAIDSPSKDVAGGSSGSIPPGGGVGLPWGEQYPSVGDMFGAWGDSIKGAVEGLIQSKVPGRTDQLPLKVGADSYIVPADIVSGMGQGNTDAGARMLDELLKLSGHESGGSGPTDQGVDIIVAGGEYVIPPVAVKMIGGGDVTKGHKILDKMVNNIRKQTASRLLNLPGPKRD